MSSLFVRRPLYGKDLQRCSLLIIPLDLSVISKMGPFLIIVVNLYSYKDSDVDKFT